MEEMSGEPRQYFVFDLLNSDCGVFCNVLTLPFAAWVEKMHEIDDKITALFRPLSPLEQHSGDKRVLPHVRPHPQPLPR